LVTVLSILEQALGYCSDNFGSGCWLLFPSFWSRLLVAVPISSDQAVDYLYIILDQAVGYCSHFLKSGCWSLLLLIWIRLLVTVPIFKNQAVGHCCYYFGSGC
jgi:hypothetical protein